MIISLESTPDNILRPYLDESICKPGETRERREESDGIQPADGLNKKTLALVKNEQLEELKLSKFNGQGRQRYLNYYAFYQEFDKLVMQKPYSDSSKLRYLNITSSERIWTWLTTIMRDLNCPSPSWTLMLGIAEQIW